MNNTDHYGESGKMNTGGSPLPEGTTGGMAPDGTPGAAETSRIDTPEVNPDADNQSQPEVTPSEPGVEINGDAAEGDDEDETGGSDAA